MMVAKEIEPKPAMFSRPDVDNGVVVCLFKARELQPPRKHATVRTRFRRLGRWWSRTMCNQSMREYDYISAEVPSVSVH